MNLPKTAQIAAQYTVDVLYGTRLSLSFGVSHVTQNQYAMELIYSINSFLDKNYDLDIGLYLINNEPNYLIPFCSTYNILDLKNKRTPKIIADPLTFASCPISNYDSVWYYVYDPSLFAITKPETIKEIINCNCKFIARNANHRTVLRQKFNINCESTLVPNCEIDLFKKVIYG